MKILFLTNNLNGDDGWSRYSVDLIQEISSLGNEAMIIGSDIEKSITMAGKKYNFLSEPIFYLFNPVKSWKDAYKINRLLKEFSPDIIHFITEPYVTFLPFLKTGKAKIVLTVHGTYSVPCSLFDGYFKRKLAHYFYQKCYNKSDVIIAVSHFTKNHLIKYFPKLSSKTIVVNNGINLSKYPLSISPAHQEEIKKILFVGSVKERKGVLQSIEALKNYKENFSDQFKYYIVGSYFENDNYFQECLSRIRDYGLQDNIVFTQRVSDEKLAEFYRNSDLFLMLSINNGKQFEGFGLVYLEANAWGVPCIGSINCGVEDAIADGKTGYLANPFKSQDVALKIDNILTKKLIAPVDCINWANEHNIKIKAKEVLVAYNTTPM
jgi:glycosyltransferase involved in cell wall biosynthesis